MSNIELLSPVGDFECLKAAVQAGADCVYFGGSMFNARASAGNFNDEELKKAIEYAKIRNVKTNLALNILIKDDEFDAAFELARKAYEYGIDAIIVQDLGLAKKLIEKFPDLPIHASTQMTIHNLEGVHEAEKLGFKRVVLSRELSLNEIKYICENSNVEIEVFVHGALCICYSGQCLLSSMIGARSGNRGKCAQPCRLSYELLNCPSEDTCSTLDKGFLLSPRDLCSLDLLPELVKIGISSFKIEGRLKTPEYVSTVTRIYRKYIDLAESSEPYVVEEADKKALLQVFNRGGFSTGYLENEPNQNLIYKNKPNNIGIFLGTVHNFNPNKGYITLKLENPVSIGDSVSLEKEKNLYNISELMMQNNNLQTANKGDIVKIGRIKGKISVGDKIYKINSKELNIAANNLTNSESRKSKINCKITVKANEPVCIHIYTGKSASKLYTGIDFVITSDLIPVQATNLPITVDRIKEQINKLGGTPFEFENIDVELGDNLYIPSISKINQLRRDAIDKLCSILQERIHRTSLSAKAPSIDISMNKGTNKTVSILFNNLIAGFDYTLLNNVNRVYIPLRFWVDDDYYEILQDIASNYSTYIYMPSILKNTSSVRAEIEKIINTYTICGFVVSNLSNLEILNGLSSIYEIIANYTMNIYNSNTISELEKMGVKSAIISPEIDKNTINAVCNTIPVEAIVYGYIPVMTTNYCLLSKSNNCLQVCKSKCAKNSNKYYLKDRLGLHFRIVPDSYARTTTIYNSKKISYSANDLSVDSIRLDFMDEKIEEINNIISKALSGEILEGQEFTNGNYNRMV